MFAHARGFFYIGRSMAPEAGTPPGPPRSLYHKERPSSRPRSTPAPEPIVPASAKDTRPRMQPGVEHLLKNLRTFGIVIGGMLLLLIISILALHGVWAVRDRELATDPQPDLLGSGAATGRVETGSTPPPTQGLSLARQATVELDTERIRRAIFLAKHAQALDEAGSLQEAAARYREALDVWPHLSAVWGQLGRVYLKTREFNKAQLALEKAVQGSPGTAELMNDLGAALLYQGQVDRAISLFDAAAEIDPLFPASQFNLALCHMARNDRVAARASLQQYLRLRPRDARALREQAFLDALEAQYDAAIRGLERAMLEAPDWALLYFDAAAVSALMGRLDQAITYLEKAEPLSSPRAVFQIYREPAFREIRLTELGKEFEHELASRARERMNEQVPAEKLQPPAEPLISVDATAGKR